MFFNKLIILFFLFFFITPLFAMDFSDDAAGMDFGADEVKTTKKVKKTKKPKKKKKIVKKTDEKEKDSEMTFGDDTTSTDSEESGMTFGEEESGMTFGEEEIGNEGKIKQEEMNFDLTEVEKTIDPKKSKKEDKVKIVTKKKSYVVKGVYFKFATGTTYLLAPKLSDTSEPETKSLLGFNTHLSLGYDLNSALSLELYSEFIFNQAQIKSESNILYNRDFNSRTIGLGINFNLLNSERTNLHLNLHGGALLIDSSLEMDGIKVSGGGLIGFEYYMLLRHFSTSVFVSTDYMTGYDTLSVSLAASIKYSF